jgi:hypothetical protein
MPTDPLDSILYRELSIARAEEIIGVASPLLKELVNYATNALARCAGSASGNKDEDLSVLALYRHIIEMTDGIEVLVSQCCAIPAIPLVRSSFEALLSIEYILENEKDYIRRSLSWLVGYVHQRLDLYERLDISTPKGKETRRFIEEDAIASRLPLPPLEEARKAKANLQSLLAKPHLQPIEAEFSGYRRTPHWYKLYGGPSDLPALARHLNRRGHYELLHRSWSRVTHAQDLLPFLDRTAKGESAIGQLRDPSQLNEIASLAASFVLEATRRMLGKFRPGEDLSRWYEAEIQERFRFLTRAS